MSRELVGDDARAAARGSLWLLAWLVCLDVRIAVALVERLTARRGYWAVASLLDLLWLAMGLVAAVFVVGRWRRYRRAAGRLVDDRVDESGGSGDGAGAVGRVEG